MSLHSEVNLEETEDINFNVRKKLPFKFSLTFGIRG